MTIQVKICGLKERGHVETAAKAGAVYVGFVLFEKSPRHIGIEQMRELALSVPVGVAKVALVVNPNNETLDMLTSRVAVDLLQLHGKETPERVTEIKQRYGLPVMKAVGVSDASDLPQLDVYQQVADQILVDAKAPQGADLPGGNGLAFDWRLLQGRKYWQRPWMLAGGLTPDNVAEAIRLTGANQVDVSSGVETTPGVKDKELIKAFIDAARA